MRISYLPNYNCLFIICSSIFSISCTSVFPVEEASSKEPDPVPNVETNVQRSDSGAFSVKTVQTEEVKTEAFSSAIEVSGKALAVRESLLSLGVPGLISKITVKRGDRVKKGQLLLRLDRRGFELGVKQAEAAQSGANAATDQLVTEIARVKQLLAENAAPSAALDDLLAKEKAAKAQVNMTSTSVEQAKKALRDSELRAPYNGVITDIFKEKGEQAPAMPPTILMKIVDASELDVQVFVPEEASRYVQVGTEAEVEVESAGVTVKGKAVFVSDEISQGARTFETRIRIDNSANKIKAGSFARVRLNTETLDDAILIPVSLLLRNEKNEPYVFVEEKGFAKKRSLVIGRMDGTRVLVRSGLSTGDKLIVSDTSGLVDNNPVTVEN